MNLDALFEDLDAKYEADLSSATKQAVSNSGCSSNGSLVSSEHNLVEVVSARSIPEELMAPILGQDFIAGMDLYRPIWVIYRTAALTSFEFKHFDDPGLPVARVSQRQLGDLVMRIPKFVSISWRIALGHEDSLQTGQLVNQTERFMQVQVGQRLLNLDFHSLEQVKFNAVDNLGQ